jgi:CO/xanthine dehydrogenase Mo-binding subunit
VSETIVAPVETDIEAPAERGRYVGVSLPRKEDRRLLQGQGTFVDDIRRHNMGYARPTPTP